MSGVDMTRVLPQGITTMISAGGILMLSVIIVSIIIIIKRWRGRFLPLLLGAVSYFILIYICTNLFIGLLSKAPGVSSAFETNPTAYIIVYGILSSVMFTLARVITCYMFNGRYERKGDIYLGGIGIGLGDAVLYGINAMYYYVACIGIQREGLEALYNGLSQDQITQTDRFFSMLFIAPAFFWLLMGINYVLDMILSVALLNAVYGAVKGEVPKWIIAAAGGIQFAATISFQMNDIRSATSILICFAIKLVIVSVAIYYLFSLAKKGISYSED